MTFIIGLLSRPFLLIFLAVFVLLISFALSKKNKIVGIFGVAILWLAIINIFSGNVFASQLIDKYGKNGEGVVISSYLTNNYYNEEPVRRYETLLELEDGEIFETYFESWDFNIYPKPENGYVYPPEGQRFKVKYMAKNPKQFIILANAASEYVVENRCSEMFTKRNEVKNKFDFAPENEVYKNTLIQTTEEFIESDCEKDENVLESLKSELEGLKEG